MIRRLALASILVLAALPSRAAIMDHGIQVEGQRVMRPGQWRIRSMFSLEGSAHPGHEAVTRQAIRVKSMRFPVSFRYGFNEKLELGMDVQAESNDGTQFANSSVFESDGISHIDAIGKFHLFPWTSMVARIGLFGDNELYHGMRGPDLGIDFVSTLPVNVPIGMPNVTHINLGFRFKTGRPDIDANGREDVTDYTNPLHLGASFVCSPKPWWSVIAEFTASSSALDLEEEAELSLGSRFGISERTDLDAALALGMTDGAPDWSLRIGMSTTFGSATEREIVKRQGRELKAGEIEEEGRPMVRIAVEDMLKVAYDAYSAGKYEEAIDAFTEVASRLSSDGRVYFNLGVCYYQLKQYRSAENHFYQALTLIPDDPEIHLYLGHALYLQGAERSARKHWNEVLRLQPGNSMAKFLLDSTSHGG